MTQRLASAIWLAWAVWFGVLTWPLWQWHLEYFRSPGPAFYKMALVFVPALGASAWIYGWRRKPAWARYEPAVFAVLIAGACLAYEPRATLVVAALFFSCSAAGRFAMQKFKTEAAGPLQRLVFGFGFGGAILNVALFGLGAAGLLYPLVFLVLLLLPLVLFRENARRTFDDIIALGRVWRRAPDRHRALTGVAVVFALAAVVFSLMIALAPAVAFDAIAFHLAIVRDFAAHHRLRQVPAIDYSLYPQGMELLWTLAFSLGRQAAAQLVSALDFLLFTLTLLSLARECGLTRQDSVLAAVFAVTMPFVHWAGSVMKNDLALAYYCGLALLAYVRWRQTGRFAWIAAGTFLLAQAFGIKLVALFAAVPLALLYGYAAWRQPRRWRSAALLLAIFALFGTWWMIRAYVHTGNPVAPEKLHAATGAYSGRGPLLTKAVRDLKIPWSLSLHGENFFESPLPSPAGILLLALGPLLILAGRARKKNSAQFACALFAALYLIYWAVAIRKVRYAVLPFGLLAVWMAATVSKVFGWPSRLLRVSLGVVMTYALLAGVMGLLIIGINGPQVAYFLGRMDRDAYLRAVMRPYGAVEYLRRNAPAEARILGVDDFARAYSADPARFEAIGCPEQSHCEAAQIVAAANSGIEYIILPQDDPAAAQALARLGRTTPVYRDSYFSVYRIGH